MDDMNETPVFSGDMPNLLSFDQAQMQAQEQEQAMAARQRILDELAKDIADKLQKAVTAREASGIERVWREDEEAYAGIDAANRSEESFVGGYVARKPDTSGAITEERKPSQRSTVLLNITAHYVDAGAARLADMLLPTDDQPWVIKPTPIPDMIAGLPDDTPISTTEIDPQTGQPKTLPKKAVVEAVEKAAREQAAASTKRISDWLVQCQWHAEVRSVIEEAARIGVSVLKGPAPRKQRSTVALNMGGGAKAVMTKEEIIPGSKWVSAWNFFPEGTCGEDIHRGSHVFERDYATARMVQDFKGLPGYLEDQLDLALKDGPSRYLAGGKISSEAQNTEPYEVWYYTGFVRADILQGCGCNQLLEDGDALDEDEELTKETLPVILTMINDRVVRASLNPLDTGEFPYDVPVWQRREGHWAGIGIARKVRTPQRIVTAGTRAMMDNAGDSASSIALINQKLLQPADRSRGWTLGPRSVYLATDTLGNTPMRDAFDFKDVPNHQVPLLNIIEFGIRMAEEVSGLPQLLQGQQGQATETLGGMQLLNTNAHTTLRRLAKLFDDRVFEPHIRRYYAWLLLYGEDDEKGDVVIEAVGASSLVEKDLQTQGILQAAPMVNDPRFDIDPKKYAREWFRAMRIAPERLQYDKGEAPQLQPPAPPPQVMVADMNAKSRERMQQAEQAFKLVLDERNKAFEAHLKNLDQELAVALAQGKEGVDLAKVRAALEDTRQKINKDYEIFNAQALLKSKLPPGYFEG